MSDHKHTSTLKKKMATMLVIASLGVTALSFSAAAPAGAMIPRPEFRELCGLAGGTYQNTAPWQRCVFETGIVVNR